MGARVVRARVKPEAVACRVLSRAGVPDVAVTRVVAEVVRREDTGAVRDEVGGRDAGDGAGEVDAFVRWRGLMREVVRLLVFVSDISVMRVDPDKVRSRPKLPGTDKVVEEDGFDRRETREECFLTEAMGDGGGKGGVVLLPAA